jgi:uncharacterized membrane protein
VPRAPVLLNHDKEDSIMTQEQTMVATCAPDEWAALAEAIDTLASARCQVEDQLTDARAVLEGVQRDFDRLQAAWHAVLTELHMAERSGS